MGNLSDFELVVLYRYWSEETYRAGFITPSEGYVRNFIMWLRSAQQEPPEKLESYEQEMVARFRKMITEQG